MKKQVHTTAKTIPQPFEMNQEEHYKRQLLDLLDKIHNPKLLEKIRDYVMHLYISN